MTWFRKKELKECRRVLQENGFILTTDMHGQSLWKRPNPKKNSKQDILDRGEPQ